MKSISTLVEDIYGILKNRDGWFSDDLSHHLSTDVARRLQVSLNDHRSQSSLRLSQIGRYKCPRALWYSVRHPELAEPTQPWAIMKFSYGHMIEALVICLAKASGHEVVGEQDAVIVSDIVGHRDCIIDGCLFDVKSSSTPGMEKFRERTLWQNDSFGYLEQLDGYVCGSLNDPLLRVKDKAYILAVDKQLGHMVVYEHEYRQDYILRRIQESIRIVELDRPPPCGCKSIRDGESGNLKLDVAGSYNAYKHSCNPGLRTFLYAKGPVYLTHVAVRPKNHIIEIDQHGTPVH